jgi:hypothetical protein
MRETEHANSIKKVAIPSEAQFSQALMLASSMLEVDDMPEWPKTRKL